MPTKKAKKKNVTKKGYTAKVRNEAMHLIFEEKLTLKEVAAKSGCSVNTIQSWKKRHTPAEAEVPVPKKSTRRKASKPQPKKVAAKSQIAFDDFVRNYWNEGKKAVDVLLLPQEISQLVSQYVNEALRYAYDQLRK